MRLPSAASGASRAAARPCCRIADASDERLAANGASRRMNGRARRRIAARASNALTGRVIARAAGLPGPGAGPIVRRIRPILGTHPRPTPLRRAQPSVHPGGASPCARAGCRSSRLLLVLAGSRERRAPGPLLLDHADRRAGSRCRRTSTTPRTRSRTPSAFGVRAGQRVRPEPGASSWSAAYSSDPEAARRQARGRLHRFLRQPDVHAGPRATRSARPTSAPAAAGRSAPPTGVAAHQLHDVRPGARAGTPGSTTTRACDWSSATSSTCPTRTFAAREQGRAAVLGAG